MASSGTWAFSPEISDLTDEAFERAGIDPETLTARHLRSARRSLNYVFADWANEGVNLWTIDQVTVPLVQGTATYNVDPETIGLLEVFLRRDGSDTIVSPMARDEYAYIPTKDSQGMPTQYYFNRQRDTPTITLWQVPENSTDELIYFRWRQLEDVGAGSNTPDVPYRWQEAVVAALAARVAGKFNAEREQPLLVKAAAAFTKAKIEDRQRTPTRMKVVYR